MALTPQRLPEVLSRAEVAAVLGAPISLKARTLLMTACATGMRVSELCNLRGCDIDITRSHVHPRRRGQGWARSLQPADAQAARAVAAVLATVLPSFRARGPRRAGCGSMCAMTDLALDRRRQRRGSNARPTARVSTPRAISRTGAGIPQADAFAGYSRIYEGGRIVEAACWSHARRKRVGHERQHKLPGTLAHQRLQRIAKIIKIEAEIRDKSVLRRRPVRQLRTRLVLVALKIWMNETLAQVSAKSPMALAIGYAVSHWSALVRFVGDGRIVAENNPAERALRAMAIRRKNFLHLGSDAGGDSAAVIYTLIGTAKLNAINPQHYLRYVLERVASDTPGWAESL
jgi:hypothetical protein